MNLFEDINNIFTKNKDKDFLISDLTGKTLTYGDLYKSAMSFASYMQSVGLKKGDKVVVIMENCDEVVQIYFSLFLYGSILVPINPDLTNDQIWHIINDSDCRKVICGELEFEKINKNSREIKFIVLKDGLNTINKIEEPYIDFEQVISSNYDKKAKINFHGVDDNNDLIHIYTSGTTGEPKKVVHSYSNILNNGFSFVNATNLGSKNRFINYLPVTYLGGYYNLLLIPLLCGGSVVITNHFNSKILLEFWDKVDHYEINTLWFVPTILNGLLKLDKSSDSSINKIDKAFIGMDIVPIDLKEKFGKQFSIKLLENYGLTETLFISTESDSDNSKTAGKLLNGVKIRILEKNNINEDNNGEILVQSPYLMKNSNKTHFIDFENEEWFPTGDLGNIDQNEYLTITGRKKDLIIKGGVNISPSAIEQIIYSLDAINECAIIGLPHSIKGEIIILIYNLVNNISQKQFEKIIIDYCSTRLSSFQQPDYFFEVSSFPKTNSGKIRKIDLKNWTQQKFNNDKDIRKFNYIDFKVEKGLRRKDYFQPSKVVGEAIQATSIKLNNKVYDKKLKGEDVIVLSLGEAFFDIPLYNFENLPFPDIYHYSHSRGIIDLREKISEYFSEQYDFYFNPEKEIIITAGSKIAIHMSLMSILNPGDEAIIPDPAWVSYPEQVRLCYGIPIQIPYDVSVFDFENYITNRTKVIIINTPHNPTGKIYSYEELDYLYDLAVKYDLYILSDEAYSDFLLDEDKFISIGNLDIDKKRLILCNSISKNYGISGWRLGYVISNPSIIDQILKVNQHLITCPATILEHYISKHFYNIIKITKPQILDVVEKRKKIGKMMDEMNMSYLPGKATFYYFISIEKSKLSGEEFSERLLEEYNTAVVGGIGYGPSCGQFIRVSVGTEDWAKTIKGIKNIKSLIDETKK